MYGFGDNGYGQQGYDSPDIYTPTKIDMLNKLFKMYILSKSQQSRSFVFLIDNGCFCCGKNLYGHCGVKNAAFREYNSSPPKWYKSGRISRSSMLDGGIIYVWIKMVKFGSLVANTDGQLGLGEDSAEHIVPDAIINPHFDGTDIVFIDCGNDFSLCIDKDGNAFMFGSNSCGQCAAGQDIENIKQPLCVQLKDDCTDVVFDSGGCGNAHTVLISWYPDNCLYGFGSNSDGQTGNIKDDGEDSYHYKPYLTKKSDIGMDEHVHIVRVICDESVTFVIAEWDTI